MNKVLKRIQSGDFAESLVFNKLLLLNHKVRFAKQKQPGYDLKIENKKGDFKKIEVKHIQRTGSSSNDSFRLSKKQREKVSFDFLVLVVSDCRSDDRISNIDYYVFSKSEIDFLINTKKATKQPNPNILKNYTFNLNNEGDKLASCLLLTYKEMWGKI